MAECDQGYPCDLCGHYVDSVTESALYLRYILSEIPLTYLHRHPERHVSCDTELAQYILAEDFQPVTCTTIFAKSDLDPHYVAEREQQVTRAWRRLQSLPTAGLAIPEYPLDVTPDSPPVLKTS